MEIVAFTTIVALLFLLVGLCEPLAERMRLPFSVILAAAGILIGVGSAVFLTVDFANALNFIARSFTDLPIRANSFLYIFLPTLLFQVTLGMEVRRILDDWVPIVLLAVVAVPCAIVVIWLWRRLLRAAPGAAQNDPGKFACGAQEGAG